MPSITVRKDFLITAGRDNDQIGVTTVELAGRFAVDTSSGDDEVFCAEVDVDKDLSVKTSSGNDLIGVASTWVFDDATIDAGSAGRTAPMDLVLATNFRAADKLTVKTVRGNDGIGLGEHDDITGWLTAFFDTSFERLSSDVIADEVWATHFDLNTGSGDDIEESASHEWPILPRGSRRRTDRSARSTFVSCNGKGYLSEGAWR